MTVAEKMCRIRDVESGMSNAGCRLQGVERAVNLPAIEATQCAGDRRILCATCAKIIGGTPLLQKIGYSLSNPPLYTFAPVVSQLEIGRPGIICMSGCRKDKPIKSRAANQLMNFQGRRNGPPTRTIKKAGKKQTKRAGAPAAEAAIRH